MKNFTEQIAALRAAELVVAELRKELEVIEVWDPYGDNQKIKRTSWLKARGCVKNGMREHASYDGYGSLFLCPKGTKAAYVAAFDDDDDDDEE